MRPYLVGDLFDLEPGFAFKSKDFINEGVPILKIKNVKANAVLLHDLSYVEESFLQSHQEKVARKGDLLITMSGNRHDGTKETWVGKIAEFKHDDQFLINQRVGALRLKPSIDVDLRCCGYFLSSDPFQNEFIAIATSSGGQANLSPTQILGAELKLPELKEQRAIAGLLGALDDKIENNRRMNETLEEMARAIFKSWFVDFDPVHAKAADNPPAYMDVDTAALFPSTFGDDGLPTGWELINIEEIGDVVTGKTPSTKRAEYFDTQYPFIKIPNMNSVWVTDTDISLSEAGHQTQFKKLLPKGSVIVSCIASPGAIAIVSEPSHTNQQINAVIPKRDYPTSWLFCALINLRIDIIGMASGGSVTPNLNKGDFSRIRVTQPQKALMATFDQIVGKLFDIILSNDNENKTLAELRDTLLPKLMSGEIRVVDAERKVEAAV